MQHLNEGGEPTEAATTSAAAGTTKRADSASKDLRETTRQQLIDSIGGWQGTVLAGIAPIVFVVVNASAGLKPAVISAISTSVVLTVYRLVRRQSVQQSLSGLLGVVVAALIAARTGQARGYFLLGIWQSFLYAVPFALSIPLRRPLVGWAWEFMDPTPGDDGTPWYRRRGLLGAYMIATVIATVLFLSRGVVQAALYHNKSTGWLAFARIAMGYPLFAVAVGAVYWVVRRARLPLIAAASTSAPDSDASAAQDGTVDRGLGLGQGQEQ